MRALIRMTRLRRLTIVPAMSSISCCSVTWSAWRAVPGRPSPRCVAETERSLAGQPGALVQHFLRRYRPAGDLACSPGALRLPHRCPWPENIRQVETVVRTLARQQSLRLIDPDDLPPQCRVTSRAPLTPMESAERDTILRGLLEPTSGTQHVPPVRPMFC